MLASRLGILPTRLNYVCHLTIGGEESGKQPAAEFPIQFPRLSAADARMIGRCSDLYRKLRIHRKDLESSCAERPSDMDSSRQAGGSLSPTR